MGLGFAGMSRRQFLATIAAAGGVPVLSGIAGPIIERAFAADPAGTGSLSDIEHFVFLMQENRSFDHYFGTMSSVRGFGDPTGDFRQYGFNVTTGKADDSAYVLPFRLDTTKPISNDGECITDPTHDWGPQHQAWNGGRMDQWVKVHVANDGASAGPATMGYYLQQDIPVHWALADAFTICDHYFCSVLGPTDPNRLYWISATIDPEGHNGGPLLNTPTTVPKNAYSWQTYPEALQDAGVSWKVYADQTFGPVSQAVLSGMLGAFKNFQDPHSELYQRGIKPTFPGNFQTDVKNNALPAVSWIIPNLLNCEHPALPPAFGAQGILRVLDILTSNPAVWEKTALIISYDENGGFFDHVAPPVAPPGTAGEYVTVSPLPGTAAGITGPIGLGFRVPGIVVSPYSRGGLVASDVFDHTSQLRLLERRFGVEVPNLSAWRRATTGDMTSAFNFAAPRNTSTALELDAYATRLEDLRLTALVERIEADLALGTADVAELEALVVEHPLHERITGLLMRALSTTGRQADALARFESLRARLADELGVDPSAELRDVHLAVLRGEFAPTPAAPPRPRTNLKAQLTSFVGRDDEVARIGKALEQNRLVTLVGPGGAGKTRLAAEAAARVETSDGVWLAELAPLTDGADVPQAVLGALGLREAHLLERANRNRSGRDAMGRLLDMLADKQVVLVLDNCEHLIDASARLAEHLLGQCPDLRVLTTSREPLGITGEVLLPVPPLGQPAPDTPAAYALEYPAVRLFADRAAAVRPDFVVDDANVAAVMEIVRRLDGLPLAIELAAARLRAMPLPDIASRLSDRFRLLTGGSRTALPRHRTLRAVVEWSWDLLSESERLLAERLAVFPAGVTIESATAVCVDETITPADVADLLASLVDKSLLQAVGDDMPGSQAPLGSYRLRMLETIREFGAERLADRGELGDVRRRHAEHFSAVVAEAQPHLTSADQLSWLGLLKAERDNILSALRFRCDDEDADGALQLAVEFSSYAMMMGSHPEISAWMADALAVPGSTDVQRRLIGRALYAMNSVATGSVPELPGEPGVAVRDVALDLGAVPNDVHPMVAMLKAGVAYFSDDHELGHRYLAEGTESGTEWSRAAVRMFRAAIAENEGQVDVMRRETERGLAQFRAIGERWGTAASLRILGQLRTLDGDVDGAIAAYEEAITLMREMGSREDEAFLLVRLADLRLRRGERDRALELAREAQTGAEEIGSHVEVSLTLMMRAAVDGEAGHRAEAAALVREAEERIAMLPPAHPAQSHARAMVLTAAARIAVEDGDLGAARRKAVEGYAAGVDTKDRPLLAAVGVTLAAIALEVGRPDAAATVLGASDRLRGAEDPTALETVRLTAALTDALGPDGFRRTYGTGRGLDHDAAIRALDPSTWIC